MGISRAGKGLVSVVIPIYNVEATLDECLDSIEAQTHSALEIICVNDGSTDGSTAIARRHAARDSRYVVVDKPNGGYGAACNRGIALARGTWVGIVEADDTLEPTCYEDLLACADAHGGPDGVDVVKAPYWRILELADGETSRMSCPYQGRVRPKSQPFPVRDGIELMLHHPAIWAALYRRGYLVEKDIRFVEAPGAGWVDNPFLVETLCRTDRIAYTDRPVYDYHERSLDEAEAFAARSPLVPLERWNEMMDVAALANVDDRRVLEALAVRGVTYALITVNAAGTEDESVRRLVRDSLERLDEDLVLGNPAVGTAGRRLYCQVLGLPVPKGPSLAHIAYLARETAYRVRTNGLGATLETIKRRARGGRV